MGYDIKLLDKNKQIVKSERALYNLGGYFTKDGIYDMECGITYNYSSILKKVFPGTEGIRYLNNKIAESTYSVLDNAIKQLKDDYSDDYFEPTEGNVKQALLSLYQMALRNPNAIWQIQ